MNRTSGSWHTLEPVLRNKRSHRDEKPAHHDERVASTLHDEREPARSNKDPAQPKIFFKC